MSAAARLAAARAAASLAFAAALLAAGCTRRPPTAATPAPHYVVGAGYQSGGAWHYPREDFHYSATGLAVIQPDRSGLTADGEPIDPTALTASHPTLQLPAIARITDLETGLQVTVRINDRGPGVPGRLIGLSRRAGDLLGILPGATAPVRVEVDESMSEALRDQLNGGPKLDVAAAPRTAVTAEALAPPPGIGQSTRGRQPAGASAATTAAPPDTTRIPDRLPEQVTRVPVGAPSLAITAGSFGQARYAQQVAARLSAIGARVERQRDGGATRYAVLAGPFANVAAADSALDQAQRAGVSDAEIVAQ